MINLIPAIQPDQTLESYIAASHLFNARNKWDLATEEIFQGNPKLSGDYFYYFENMLHSPLGQSFSTFKELFSQFSSFAFMLPFSSRKEYAMWQRYFDGFGIGWLMRQLSYRRYVRGNHYCPQCLENEINTIGYGYPHRSINLSFVNTCPIHHIPTGIVRDNSELETYGNLVLPTEKFSDQIDLSSYCKEPTFEFERYIPLWVKAAYDGNLPWIDFDSELQSLTATILSVLGNTISSFPDGAVTLRLTNEDFEHIFQSCLWLNNIPYSNDSTPFDVSKIHCSSVYSRLALLSAVYKTPENYLKLRPDAPQKLHNYLRNEIEIQVRAMESLNLGQSQL